MTPCWPAWQSTPEKAPSVMLEAKPTLTRFLFMVGLLLVRHRRAGLAGRRMEFLATWWPRLGHVLPDARRRHWSCCMRLSERENSFAGPTAWSAWSSCCLSAALRLLPIGGAVGARFLSVGVPGLCLGLVLIGAVLRHENRDELPQRLYRDLARFHLDHPPGRLRHVKRLPGE